MSPLTLLRWAYVIGLAGVTLLISGLFLPWIISYVSFFHQSLSDSFWAELVFQLRYGFSNALEAGFYLIILLPYLTGILICLAGHFGKGIRVFFLLQLLLALLGLASFLCISYFSYCTFYCNTSAGGNLAFHGDKVLGPGSG